MAGAVTVQIKGLSRLSARMKKLTPQIEQGLTNGINRASAKVNGDAKSLVPVDTGTLRNSIHIKPAKKEGADIVGGIYTSIEYAPYVEFGTGVRGAGSYPYNPKGLSLSYGGKAGQVAQPFLYPALHKNEVVIDRLVTAAVKAALRG